MTASRDHISVMATLDQNDLGSGLSQALSWLVKLYQIGVDSLSKEFVANSVVISVVYYIFITLD